MAILKFKDAKNMSEKELESKLKDLKLELIKQKTGKGTKIKAKEIKRAIARILTIKSNSTKQ